MSDQSNATGNDYGEEDLSPAVRLSQQGDQLAKERLFKEAADAYTESVELDPHNHST